MKRCALLGSIALLAACASTEETGPKTTTGAGGATTTSNTTTSSASGAGGAPVIGGDRPVDVTLPEGLAPGERVPLVILLHGYGVSGLVEELYMQLGGLSQSRRFAYAHPTGTVEDIGGSAGSYFWNATDACCNFYGSEVDDSAYLAGVIDEIVAAYPVDPKRVYLVGHSNGGFMSYRMACDHADKVAAIVSLAGAMWQDPSKCAPSGPVHVLQIHGTADDTVIYTGEAGLGAGMSAYPGAMESVESWVALDGCDAAPDTSAAPLDLDVGLAGAETTVSRWEKGCKSGGSVALWSIAGGAHLPEIGPQFRTSVIDYLFAHPKP